MTMFRFASLALCTAVLATVSPAAELFDSPGPGYRQQMEPVFRSVTKEASNEIHVGAPIIHVVPTSFSTPTLPIPPSFAAALLGDAIGAPTALGPFAPIRLTIDHSMAPAARSGEANPKANSK